MISTAAWDRLCCRGEHLLCHDPIRCPSAFSEAWSASLSQILARSFVPQGTGFRVGTTHLEPLRIALARRPLGGVPQGIRQEVIRACGGASCPFRLAHSLTPFRRHVPCSGSYRRSLISATQPMGTARDASPSHHGASYRVVRPNRQGQGPITGRLGSSRSGQLFPPARALRKPLAVEDLSAAPAIVVRFHASALARMPRPSGNLRSRWHAGRHQRRSCGGLACRFRATTYRESESCPSARSCSAILDTMARRLLGRVCRFSVSCAAGGRLRSYRGWEH
jgi:hypothetical protein